MNPVRKFFLFCSGTTFEIITQEECRTDVSRYTMIGAFVFLTAAFASLSGGYALYTGFKSWQLAVPVGLLWGSFIFTLDRFIVSTIRKKSAVDANSFKENFLNKLGEIATALPRLILAVFIGVTVAVPLELKYFAPEITAKIGDDNRKKAQEIEKEVAAAMPEIVRLQNELKKMDDDENGLRKQRNDLKDKQFKEILGESGPDLTGRRGDGPIAARHAEEALKLEKDLADKVAANTQSRNKINAELDSWRAERKTKIDANLATIEAGDGFIARLRALGELGAENRSVMMANWFLVLLLILIETAPVVIKLFAPRGPYDDFIETIEHKVHINNQKEISNFNTDVMKELEYYEATSDARRQFDEQLSRQIINYERSEELEAKAIREAEMEITRARVDNWKRRELQRLIKAQ